ncbi:MAG: TonB-dependent hemoglobin/transferrin/lactoferrin family receptor [Xanthomonadales bacterium]|nr:TonB-dependent hemoglobin/transferrin/lactoferrin family receptor [Xanthomonadales bacterium]
MNYTLIFLAALAANPADVPEPAQLEPVVVVATRTPRPVSSVAGLVTVVDASRMDREQVRSIGDLARYEVGFSAETAGTRFGLDGFNIRGIGGNRVAIEIDGVPLGDHFDIGSFSSAGRALIDPEFIQRVEILRGPASTLYGSDAIGGIAAFHTWNPEDLTHAAGGDQAWRLRSGYSGADQSAFASVLAARSGDRYSWLGGVVYRDGDQFDHSVSSGPEDLIRARQSAALGKLEVPVGTLGQLTMTASGTRIERQSDIRSILGAGRFRRTTLLTGDDAQDRTRAGLHYDFAPAAGWADEGRLSIYYQDSDTDQFTIEERAASDTRRERRFLYEQRTRGFEAQFFRSFQALGGSHRLGYGIDYQVTDTSELRNALQMDLAGANPSTSILGEDFPVRDFPNSDTEEAALWLQDEIELGRLTLIPALRYERYSLDPEPDPIYREDNPDAEVVALDADEVTPRLGLLYDLSDRVNLFAQYARGFRAPPFEDANIGLDIPLFNIRAIPNPDLVPETSDSIELGLRYRSRLQSLELVAFHNDYSDFIETKVNLGPDPSTGTLIFQSRNVTDARIYGVEIRYRRDLSAWAEGLAFYGSAFWADGENEQTGAPLAGLDPAEAVLGLGWASADGRWSTDLIVNAGRPKDEVEDPEAQFVPAGYGTVDLLAQWTPRPGLQVGAGLFNAFDKAHWKWQGVRGLAPGDPTLPLLSQPGRHFAASIELNW